MSASAGRLDTSVWGEKSTVPLVPTVPTLPKALAVPFCRAVLDYGCTTHVGKTGDLYKTVLGKHGPLRRRIAHAVQSHRGQLQWVRRRKRGSGQCERRQEHGRRTHNPQRG